MYFMSVYLYRLTVLLKNILKVFDTYSAPHNTVPTKFVYTSYISNIIFKIQNNTADDARSSSVHINILKIVFVYLIRHNIEYKLTYLL